jgi:hypothetical protein
VSVGKTGPVNIGVDDKVRRRGTTKKQVVVDDALEVPKDALRDREMGLTRDVHVEAHLLDCIGNVGLGEGEVLESPSQAAVGSRVTDGGPISEETSVFKSSTSQRLVVQALLGFRLESPTRLSGQVGRLAGDLSFSVD